MISQILKLRLKFSFAVLLSLLASALPGSVLAVNAAPGSAPTTLTKPELEKLLQPIALYPDLLLQQLLAASTFPEQLLDAALFQEQGKDPATIKSQPWDEAVKGIANYPSILTKLAGNLDWTISLGSAFINQNRELREAIQTLRSRAAAVGNLKDSEQLDVITDTTAGGTTVIRIESASPEVIYIPTQTTTVVYQEHVDSSALWVPVATFGLGMAMGYAMADDDDDHYHYGGYYGPGFWHGDDAFDDWMDYRHDRWDDAYDFANDRQEWRQNNQEDWREYRQDLGQKQQEWRESAKNRASDMSPEQRAQARSKYDSAKTNWQGKSPEQQKQAIQDRGISGEKVNRESLNQAAADRSSKGTFSKSGSANYGSSVDRDAASQRLAEARKNSGLYTRSESFKSSSQVQNRSGTYSGAGATNRATSSRGAGLSGLNGSSSSAYRSQSRGSTSMARSGSFSGSSVSRGGGGFSRGGGGGGGRRR